MNQTGAKSRRDAVAVGNIFLLGGVVRVEQGSYMLIAKGMTAHGLDGDVGTIDEVVADPKADIFRGVVVSQGLVFQRRMLVPAEHIVGVHEQTVEVNLTKEQIEALPKAIESASETNITSA